MRQPPADARGRLRGKEASGGSPTCAATSCLRPRSRVSRSLVLFLVFSSSFVVTAILFIHFHLVFFYLCSLSYSYLCSLGYFYLCSLSYSDLFTVIFIYVHLVNFIYVHLINLIFHLIIFLYFHCLSHMIFLLQSFSFISKLLSFSLFSLFHFVFYHSHLVFSPVSENVG